VHFTNYGLPSGQVRGNLFSTTAVAIARMADQPSRRMVACLHGQVKTNPFPFSMRARRG